ncbi:hypothetical protein ACFL1H_02795 [Nanoarchaeota archaeon]
MVGNKTKEIIEKIVITPIAYHPVHNYLLRPIYKTLGGKYNPKVSCNAVGIANFLFHIGLFSLIGGIFENDTINYVNLSAAGALSLPFLYWGYEKGKKLAGELKFDKEMYQFELRKENYNSNKKIQDDKIDKLVEEEFDRRKKEYQKTPKFYHGPGYPKHLYLNH